MGIESSAPSVFSLCSLRQPWLTVYAASISCGARRESSTAASRSGEVREELLPLLWAETGLERDDYGQVLLMLSAAGLLFQPPPPVRSWLGWQVFLRSLAFRSRAQRLSSAERK